MRPPTSRSPRGGRLVTLIPARRQRLAKRLAIKSDSGLGIASEITLIGELKADVAAPALLEAFSRAESHEERLAFATACVKVADPRLSPHAGRVTRPPLPGHPLASERSLETDRHRQAAASVLWPHLAQESDLLRKLQIAAFLGGHGFRGGYPYAIEHMSVPQLQDAAVDALAAIREPKAVHELRKIWESSNDVVWNTAALRALGRLNQVDITPRLLELAHTAGTPWRPRP